jgi:hypothetical protein
MVLDFLKNVNVIFMFQNDIFFPTVSITQPTLLCYCFYRCLTVFPWLLDSDFVVQCDKKVWQDFDLCALVSSDLYCNYFIIQVHGLKTTYATNYLSKSSKSKNYTI